ncbi:MAG: 16S rRNA (guanine(966)-N(2))-methyltransferase RsmD [Fusobacteriaceae bacterium]|jgi:16S rRNA (guanine(966)-N(2))-methyltransferase RsmD|nr:16S rRNA (guanine(966)-N(2))-methyltransferase RsmD [Fusobacteriaceae bacterium]
MRIIAGSEKNRTVKCKKGLETRPTLGILREALFSILNGAVAGSRFLDLFSGSGAIALEALSRGAERAVMIESDPEALAILIGNINALGYAERCRAYKNDVFRAVAILGRKGEQFDLIFMDPPYNQEVCGKVVEAVDRNGISAAGGLVVCEHHKGEKLANKIGNFRKSDERIYRNKVFTFYRQEKENGQSEAYKGEKA